MRHISISLVIVMGGVWTAVASELPFPPDPNLPQTDFSQLEFDADSGMIIGDYRQFEQQQRFSLYTTLAQAGDDFPTDYMEGSDLKTEPVADATVSNDPDGVSDPLESVPPPPSPAELQVVADDGAEAPAAPSANVWFDSGYQQSCTSSGCTD